MARYARHTDPIDRNRLELIFDRSWRFFFAPRVGNRQWPSLPPLFYSPPLSLESSINVDPLSPLRVPPISFSPTSCLLSFIKIATQLLSHTWALWPLQTRAKLNYFMSGPAIPDILLPWPGFCFLVSVRSSTRLASCLIVLVRRLVTPRVVDPSLITIKITT